MDVMTKKVFISYSWAKQEYVTNVVNRLRHDGIDTVFDQYDLKPGNDVYKFMERAVNDDDIDYVLVFCDKTYADKANKRDGGVGTETQIITPELYQDNSPDKFIPLIIEKDGNGNPYLPTFLKSRKYIDMCRDNNDGYMELVRYIYDKPLKRKPALGNAPLFLDDEEDERIWPLKEHIDRIRKTDSPKLDDAFIDESVEILMSIVGSGPDGIEGMRTVLEKELPARDLILEYLLSMMNKHVPTGQIVVEMLEQLQNKGFERFKNEIQRELLRFFMWEMLLDYIAMCVQKKRFEDMAKVLLHPYYIKNDGRQPDGTTDYTFINRCFDNLDKTRDEKERRLLSFQSSLLIGRCYSNMINQQTLSEADIILYHLSMINRTDRRWAPFTYIYHNEKPIELWSRMRSKQFCQSILCLFDVESVEQLKALISKIQRPMDFSYLGSAYYTPWITDSIDVESIGERP